MASCEASGYGIFIKGSDGKYTFYKFDAKGNELAKSYLEKTKRKAGLIVDMAATLDGKTLKMVSLQEAAEGMNMDDSKMGNMKM